MKEQKFIWREVVKRAIAHSFELQMAERNPGTPDKSPIPEHLLYDEDDPFCAYCRTKSGLKVGRLPISGVVAFCPKCEKQFRDDKEWESNPFLS